MEFKLQRFADVIHGTSGGDYGSNIGDNTQVYGLAGNDTIETANSKNVLLIGGSGNDVIHMTGGSGTLNGGAGADTFKISYSSANTISAVIEDIDPTNDKLVINYTGSGTPNIRYSTVGRDIVLTDEAGYLNVTLKGYREANDYFDGVAHENVWEVFKIVNQEREAQGLNWLILSQGLIEGASIRAVEIEDTWGHTRPDGTSFFTAVEKSYNSWGENIAAGYGSPEAVMVGWMNSTGHRANILRDYFTKLGVGYFYKSGSYYGDYWVQMFGGALNETETVSTSAILSTKTTLTANGVTQSASTLGNISAIKYATVTGTAAADSYSNTETNAVLVGLAGNDTVYNHGDNVTVEGGTGADLIINGQWYGRGGVNVSLSGGDGNDTISSSGSNSKLDGGAGNDLIYSGYYFYESWGSDGFLSDSGVASLNDTNDTYRVTISGGKGNDEIHSRGNGSNVFICNSGDGNDTIYGYTSSDTISITGGAYTKSTVGSNVIISVGSGAVTLVGASGKTLNIQGTANESLKTGKNVYSFEESVGANDDPMNIYYYRPANWSAGDAIALVLHGMNRDAERYLSDWQSHADKNNVLLICPEFTEEKFPGSGYYNTGNVMRNGSLQTEDEWVFPVLNRIIRDVKNRVQSSDSKTLLFGHSAGAQLVHRYAIFSEEEDFDVIIPANAGWYTMPDNSIQFPYGLKGTTVTDEKLIATLAKPVVILLGEQDIVRDDNLRTTPEADAQGENRLERGKEFYQQMKDQAAALGVPFNWKISIVEGVGHNDYKMAAAAMDIYTGFLETGEIIVQEMLPAGISISNSILTASSNFTGSKIDLANYSNVTKVNASALSRGVTIVGSAAANSIKGGSGADTISGGAGNDTVSLGGGADIYIYSSGNDLIQDYAAADKIKLASASITGSSLSGNNVVLKTSSGNLTVQNGKGKNITVIDKNGNTTTKTYPESTLPAGISISNSILTASTAFTGSSVDLANYSGVTKVNASALSRGVSIVGTAAANSIKGGKGADTIFGGAGNDTVSLGGGADIYIYSGGNDLIQDYTAGADKIKLASANITSASISGSNVVLKTSAGNITLKNSKDKAITVIDKNGNTTTKTYPESTVPAGISVKGAVLTASTAFTGSLIDLADYSSAVTKVNASALSRGVSIVGTAAANSIKGGKGADTISGGAGNDTVSLGGGADVYIYSGGNDLIQDYTAGADKIKLASASITSASVSGSNVVLKTSSGNLTVKNGKNKNITVINSRGAETTKIYPETSSDSLPSGLSYDSSKKKLTVGTSYSGAAIDLKNYATTTKTVDASAFTKKISITGNKLGDSIKGGSGNDTLTGGSKADTIYGGNANDKLYGAAGNDKLYGDAGNDTLTGGAGADTLTGGDGKDFFVYASGDGKDVITDYTSLQDKIKITSGEISGTSYSGSDVIFSVGTGSITVKNGNGKKITIVDAAGKTSTRTYSSGNGNAAVPWFTEDDTNFVGSGAQLGEITSKNYSVSDFETMDTTATIAQANLLTVASGEK